MLVGPASRADAVAALGRERFDLLVIGGGITGAGIAREAALAGLHTALLERDDFASGTSSRSSRLVHGGVRYLEHGHLGLVFESSRERRLLLQLAPHLVRPLAFTWPVYRGARVPTWKVRAGLMLYDALALFRNVQRHEGLGREGVLQHEPALLRDGLMGGARYWDAATDDTRLTLASALAAREEGAVVLNHCVVTGALRGRGPDHPGRLQGVQALDRVSGATLDIEARVVINATGPWSDATATLTAAGRADAAHAQVAQVLGSAGAHIAVPRQRLGNNDAVTIVSPLDGRVMFVIPAGAHAIIGTTERPAQRGPDDIRATHADISYLLASVNRCFPFANLCPDDVISAWCGIRPLAARRANEQRANAASREHAITQREDGLITVTGGKLTTYRAMAADVFAKARSALGNGGAAPLHAPEPSDATPLPGGDIGSLSSTIQDARVTTHDGAVGERLAQAYGSRWRNVWSYVQRDPALGSRISEQLPYLLAEVAHAADREMACTLGDILIRRTHVAFETRDYGRGAAQRIAPLLQATRGWSDAERTSQLASYEAEVTRLFSIDDV
jgi:glycerol-3-phosphate dehydrogenase